MIRTAFVVPFFGPAVMEEAGQLVFEVATRLARRGHAVEVLTTCAQSRHDDGQESASRVGVSEECGVVVRRFPIRLRDTAASQRTLGELTALDERPKVVGVSPVPYATERAFFDQDIQSPDLLEHLERERHGYHATVFAPYWSGLTLQGIERDRARAFLQPVLRDETVAHLPTVEAAFRNASRVLFASQGEASLAARLFGPAVARKAIVVGGGVEGAGSPALSGNEQLPGRLPAGPFMLHVRSGGTTGTGFLLRTFARYRASNPGSRLQLVLAGPGGHERQDGVIDLGALSEADKSALVNRCVALIEPSRTGGDEAAVLQAWVHSKPVLVHGDCVRTSGTVESCRGGWTPASDAEWLQTLAAMASADAAVLRDLGERGRAYAREYTDWERVIERYEKALHLRRSEARRSAQRLAVRGIHQLLPSLDYGDAISNQTVFTREVLRDLGYESEIFVLDVSAAMRDFARLFRPGAIPHADALLYHHAIGTSLTAQAIQHPGPKALQYHNITPGHFFEPWDASFARILEMGRHDLHHLAAAFRVSAGDSTYNADELRTAGFEDPRVVPIFIDPMRWAQPADPEWMKVLQDGRTNLLFVGRVAPNKCQHHLVQAFHEYLRHDPAARLILAGVWPEGHPYVRFIREEAARLGISGKVLLTSRITDAQLLACYRTAHLFWSMSEPEGFCAPLIEAMWFDVPVLAYKSSAIPETLGQAGIMFTEKRWAELAALAHMLVEDRALRRKVVAAQRARRTAFLPEAILPALLDLLARLGAETRSAKVPDDQPRIADTNAQYPSMMRGQR